MTEQTTADRSVIDSIRQAVEGASSSTVFGEPISRDGVTIVPVAQVSGGGGGGGQALGAGGPRGGSGGGFGVSAKPMGVFVIRNGKACWRPAVDVNRLIIAGQIFAIVALVVVRAIIVARRSRPAD